MNEIEQLQRKLAAARIEARLAHELDRDYAAIQAERNADRVRFENDSSPMASSVENVANEILSAADPKWRRDTAPKRDPFHTSLRKRVEGRMGVIAHYSPPPGYVDETPPPAEPPAE
jgi:hypothetical protein